MVHSYSLLLALKRSELPSHTKTRKNLKCILLAQRIPSIMRMKQSCGESGKVSACWALQMDEGVRLEHCAVDMQWV